MGTENRENATRPGYSINGSRSGERATGSAGVDVNMNGQDENSVESEEDKRVDRNRLAVGLHAAELDLPVVARNLEKQSRLQ